MILPGFRTKLRTILIVRIAVILLATVLLIGANLYVRATKQVASITDRIIDSSARLIDQRLDGMLAGAESQAALLSSSMLPMAVNGGVDVQTVSAPLISLLDTNPGFSSASVTLDATGETIRVQRQSDLTLVVQDSIPTPLGSIRTDYAPFGGALRQVRREKWNFDGREQGYYRKATSLGGLVWSDTHLIESPSGIDGPGVTCATAIVSRQGKPLGCVAIDFTLGDLSRFLQTIQAGENGYAFLSERSPNGVRLVAHPNANQILVTQNGQQRIATLAEVNDPILTSLVDRLATIKQDSTSIVRSDVSAKGQKYLVGMKPVSRSNSPDWIVTVVVPESDFIEGLKEQGLVILAITVLALVGAIAGSMVLAGKVTEPLQNLVRETERIRELQLEPRSEPLTPIQEIADLAISMEQMKTGLRSLQKLVPAEYARWLIQSGQEARLGGERRHMSISFADLIGFTALSETVAPEVLSKILSEYLDVLSNEILKTDGTIDKFNGDDVMAFWGAPLHLGDHALAACKTAISSRKVLATFHDHWESSGIPRLRVSWGLATGDVIVGNVGSRERMNYTVIGDTVNLASRLQGINRAYGTELLASAATVNEAGDEIASRLIDWVIPLGKELAVEVHELCGLREDLDPSWGSVLSFYATGLSYYRERKWDKAAQEFRRALEFRGGDGPSRVMLARCERYIVNPPEEDWDGSYRIGSK